MKRQLSLGKDIHFWLDISGLDRLPIKKLFGKNNPVLDSGIYREAINHKKIKTSSMFKSFSNAGIILENRKEERVDSVIFATEYKQNLT